MKVDLLKYISGISKNERGKNTYSISIEQCILVVIDRQGYILLLILPACTSKITPSILRGSCVKHEETISFVARKYFGLSPALLLCKLPFIENYYL